MGEWMSQSVRQSSVYWFIII